MATKNDITGDLIKTKAACSEAYAEGWNRIFGPSKFEQRVSCEALDELVRDAEEMGLYDEIRTDRISQDTCK
jgi:hypothetical protein